MKIRWDVEKSRVLKYQRGVSFEEMMQHRVVAVIDHPQRPHQQKMLFEYHGCIWAVPFVVRGDEIFLKTMYPSRRHTRLYREGGLDEEKDRLE